MRILRASAAAAVAAAFAQASAQIPVRQPPTPRAGSTFEGEWAMEQEVRDRWMHGHQQSRFSPFASNHAWVFVDSVRDGEVGRRLYLTLRRSVYGRDSALIVVGPTGRIVQLHVGLAPYSRHGSPFPDDSARFVESRRRPLEGSVSLAETRVWDFVPTFPRATPRAGLSWTDTIARVATDGPFRQSLHGTRSSRIAGDTVVAGHRLWVVRDSAVVQYEEHYLEGERTLDTTVQVSRSAAGTVRGVHLYDPELRLFRRRDDTTRLVGTAVLRYPDDRSFRTPARYERMRHWDLYSAPGYADRLAELRSAAGRAFGGMVRVPRNELQRRLASGDVVVRDSVVRQWQRTSDPDEAGWLFGLLAEWVRSPSFSERLDSLRVAAGDTAYLYQRLADRAFTRDLPTDTADLKAMLRFMQDPSIAWGFNLSRDWLYENLVQALTTWPRAAAIGPDNGFVACTIAACRLLGEQWRAAREPRLRDVGLVALVSLDARRWADTVLALDGPRHPLLHSAAMLAMGVGATWPAASKAPLPPANSDWRAWLEWMNGVDQRYITAAAAPGSPASRATPHVRFDESHRTAIRFYTARTGRDVVEELRRGYDAAASDSARLVFGTMLQQLGELRLTEAEIAEAFTSAAPARIALARQALVAGFYRSAMPMNQAAAALLMDRLLAAVVDTVPLWRVGAADLRTSQLGALPGVHARIGRIFLDSDSLPDAIHAKWAGRLQIITPAEWNRRDPRTGGVFYTVAPIRSWGRFARVELTLSERITRPEGQAPAQYASANTYYLMELNGEWVIVAQDGWIT